MVYEYSYISNHMDEQGDGRQFDREKKLGSKVVVFGSTGYVGTRLVSRLIKDGYEVKATYRDKNKLKQKLWYNRTNVTPVYCDIFNPKTVKNALEGCDYAYYLIHSMDTNTANYESLDRKAANILVDTISQMELKKLVYLGGLGDVFDNLSEHLQSRIDVGNILKNAGTETIILRAAILIGSGGASFEIMRYLVDKLPIMISPKWTHKTKSQPIAIRNAVEYLVGAIEVDALQQGTYDIGGPDIVTYNDMMQSIAEENGLRKRLIIPVPVLTPKLSARWIRLVTPVDENVATSLIDGLRNDAVCLNDEIKEYIPQRLLSVNEAIKRALHEKQYTLLRNAYGKEWTRPPIEWSQPGDPEYAGGKLYYDRRAVICDGKKEDVWKTIIRIGGDNGWYYMNYLWKFRGMLDELVGGPGMRRGRKNPEKVEVGDTLDCWRVVTKKENEELTLRAEMKIFGIGTLKFKIHQDRDRSNRFIVEQHASYVPRGLAGIIYWKIVQPLHNMVFYGMLREIIERSNADIVLGPKILPTNKKIRLFAPYITAR